MPLWHILTQSPVPAKVMVPCYSDEGERAVEFLVMERQLTGFITDETAVLF